MRSLHSSFHAERSIRLKAENFGAPCLQVEEAPLFEVCAPDRFVSIHNAAPSNDILHRAVEAFNAVMDGRETPPRSVPIVAVIEDRERMQAAE